MRAWRRKKISWLGWTLIGIVIVLVVIFAIVGTGKKSDDSTANHGYLEVKNYTAFGFELWVNGKSQGFLPSGETWKPPEGYDDGTKLHVVAKNISIDFHQEHDVVIKRGKTIILTIR